MNPSQSPLEGVGPEMATSETHVHKITDVGSCFLYGAWTTRAIGRGEPLQWICPHQNHYVPRHTNRYGKLIVILGYWHRKMSAKKQKILIRDWPGDKSKLNVLVRGNCIRSH
jgi:hypothetical protein